MAFNVENMDTIKIWDEEFKGIGYQGLMTTNTKTYVEPPERTLDGSMPNIDDHDTFIVPRAEVNFKLFSIEDYQRFCYVVNLANQFPVTYFDKQVGEFVTHYMYIEPEEMKKMFNVGSRVVGVLDYRVSFIGTRNNIPEKSVTYYLNSSSADSSILSTANYVWGSKMEVMTGDKLVELANEKGYALPGGTFVIWNTRPDGKGINYRPDLNATIFSNVKLYAIWG